MTEYWLHLPDSTRIPITKLIFNDIISECWVIPATVIYLKIYAVNNHIYYLPLSLLAQCYVEIIPED